MASLLQLLTPFLLAAMVLLEAQAQGHSGATGSRESHNRKHEREREREHFARNHHRRGDRGHTGGGRYHDSRLRSGSLRHAQGATGYWDTSSNSGTTNNRQARQQCPPSSFLNKTTRECVECSHCPVNEIIRRPCSAHRDTVCGPFYEFKPGHQGGGSHTYQRDDPHLHAAASNADHDNQYPASQPAIGGHDSESDKKGNRTDVTAEEQRYTQQDKSRSEEMADGHTKGPTVHKSAEQWRELCYGLIGALAAVTLLALLYIIVTQLHARRNTYKYSDAQCRTVLSPTMRVFANGLLSNTDYQKITPYADESSSRRSRYRYIRNLLPWLKREKAPLNHYVHANVGLSPSSSGPHAGGSGAGGAPEVVEMERLHHPMAPAAEAAAVLGQGGAGHGAQGHRLESTQSWDSGISTHDGNKV